MIDYLPNPYIEDNACHRIYEALLGMGVINQYLRPGIHILNLHILIKEKLRIQQLAADIRIVLHNVKIIQPGGVSSSQGCGVISLVLLFGREGAL